MNTLLLFKRVNNNFSDILSEKIIKKNISAQITFHQHLLLGHDMDSEQLLYITLKYGHDIVNLSDIVPDRTPILGKDYVSSPNIRYQHILFQK
jgi:hypothetical protein